ncbi:alpha amylase C-terminal domain-containing protein, partial [Thermodesulfobacteriota bacterium]
QWNEWYHETSLDWNLLDYPLHRGVQQWVRDLNNLYRSEPALNKRDFDPAGFEWIDCNDSQQSTLSMMRKGDSDEDTLIIICNFTPVPRHNFIVGAPKGGPWKELLNSDAVDYGGSGKGNLGLVKAETNPFHGRPYSFNITIPPLSIVFFKIDLR